MALTRGQYPAAVAAAERGLRHAGQADVAAQLHAQAAKAHARSGDLATAGSELAASRAAIRAVDPCASAGPGHFHVDERRIAMHAMQCQYLLGQDEHALTAALQALRDSSTSAGAVTEPMPYADAAMVAAVLARRGNTTAALRHAAEAARVNRRSLPSLQMLATDVIHELGDSAGSLDLSLA